MAKRFLVLALLAAAIVGVASASAARDLPASQTQLGVLGDPASFDRFTGQQTTVRLTIVPWQERVNELDHLGALLATMSDEPMLGIGVPNGSPLTPQAIAQGQGDDFLVSVNQAIVQWDKPIYVRPLAEMNGWWNSYCAFNHNGSSKGPRYSSSNFRKAFERIYLILHGAPNANSKLEKMGMPPVNGVLMPAPMLRVVWNPQGFGSPDLPGNSAQAYYPGDGFVDIVGDDLYDIRGKAEFPAADALYRAHPRKPFAFGEWGLWGLDDPAFVRDMAGFVRAHRRTVLINYFNSKPGSTWDLQRKPRSLKLYRQLIVPLGN